LDTINVNVFVSVLHLRLSRRWRFKTRSSGLWRHVVLWWWRQHGPLKRWYPTTILYGVTAQKTSTWKGNRYFSLVPRPDRILGPHSFLFCGFQGVLSLVVKWQEYEDDYSSPCRDEIKKMCKFTSGLPTLDFTMRTALITTHIRGCNQKFPDWPPGARTANGTALCH
jgi:hypothetical protein